MRQQLRIHLGPVSAEPVQPSDVTLVDLLNAEGHLPRLRFQGPLGHGGQARLLAAYDQQLQRAVAIKFVPEADLGAGQALQRERQALAALSHPNILPLLDAGFIDSGWAWISMPVVRGESMASSVAPLPWRHAVRVLLPIAEALAHAHDRGWVHGDVNPGNILLAHDEAVVLVDWGSARRLHDHDHDARPQAPASAAPECFSGQVPDIRSDLYSFGTCLHQAIIGRTPRGVDARGKRLPLTAEERRRCPKAVRAILDHTLAEQPAARYQAMPQLVADLRALMQDQAPSVCPDSWPMRLWRQARRQPAGFVAVCLLLVSLLTVAVLVHQRWSSIRRQWQLVYATDFKQAPDTQRWRCHIYPGWNQASAAERPALGATSPWQHRDGAVESRWTEHWHGAVTWEFAEAIGPDIRLSWQVQSLEGGENLNAFIGPNRFDGWGLHIAGFERRRLIALTDGRFGQPAPIVAAVRLPEAIQVGQDYQVQMSLVGRDLRVLLDGQQVLSYRDPLQLGVRGDLRCGWETARARIRLDDIRIERLGRSRLVPAHAIADHLLAIGRIPEALREYDQLVDESAPVDEQAWIAFQRARCQLALGHEHLAQRYFQALAEQAGVPRIWQGLAVMHLCLLAIERQDLVALEGWSDRLVAVGADATLRAHVFGQISSERWHRKRLPTPGSAEYRSILRQYGSDMLAWRRRLDLSAQQIGVAIVGSGLHAWGLEIVDHLLLSEFEQQLRAIDPQLLQDMLKQPGLPDRRPMRASGSLPDPVEAVVASGQTRATTLSAAPPPHRSGASVISEWRQGLVATLQDHDRWRIESMLQQAERLPYTRGENPQRTAILLAVIFLGLDDQEAARRVLQEWQRHPKAKQVAPAQAVLRALVAGTALPLEPELLAYVAPLALLQALQAELQGRRDQALAAYRRVQTETFWWDLVQWRLQRW